MEKSVIDAKNRVALDRRPAGRAKATTNPIGDLLTPAERAKILAAMAVANKKTNLFPQK